LGLGLGLRLSLRAGLLFRPSALLLLLATRRRGLLGLLTRLLLGTGLGLLLLACRWRRLLRLLLGLLARLLLGTGLGLLLACRRCRLLRLLLGLLPCLVTGLLTRLVLCLRLRLSGRGGQRNGCAQQRCQGSAAACHSIAPSLPDWI
jgi:hypothetical protein